LTDGEWVWPEGLSHYVEYHNLILPDEVVQTMRRNNYQIPSFDVKALAKLPSDPSLAWNPYSVEFWKNYSKRAYEIYPVGVTKA